MRDIVLLLPLVITFTQVNIISSGFQYPNIIFILADDLGWNDVGFHGSNQIPTPNIDALAYSGIILNNYYTQPICSASRSALLTGRHPIHNGMQGKVLNGPQPWGLPLDEILLPTYLKRIGYTSRIVGKWHLGHFKEEYTPTFRGFDSHYGFWLGHQNYYNHTLAYWSVGYDFRRDMSVTYEGSGVHNTELFSSEAETIIRHHDFSRPLFLYLSQSAPHTPLQAPQYLVDKFRYIPHKKRRKYAALVTLLDESVGRVVAALKDKGILDRSIVVFSTDNGGAVNGFDGSSGSNWPLRGMFLYMHQEVDDTSVSCQFKWMTIRGKDTLLEGGIRGSALVWSPLLNSTSRVHNGLMHIQDWIPTFIAAAKATHHFPELKDMDGRNQWPSLSDNADPPYFTLLHNIDPMRKVSSLRKADWKLVKGRTHHGAYDGWYGPKGRKREYDLDAVKESVVARVIHNIPDHHLPSDTVIHRLRNEATVTCLFSGNENRRKKSSCRPHKAPCLFNLAQDPCEERNVAKEYEDVLNDLTFTLQQMSLTATKPRNKRADRDSNPKYWNHTWTHWKDFPRPTSTRTSSANS